MKALKKIWLVSLVKFTNTFALDISNMNFEITFVEEEKYGRVSFVWQVVESDQR